MQHLNNTQSLNYSKPLTIYYTILTDLLQYATFYAFQHKATFFSATEPAGLHEWLKSYGNSKDNISEAPVLVLKG